MKIFKIWGVPGDKKHHSNGCLTIKMFPSSKPRPDPPFVLQPSIQDQRALQRLLASISHPVQAGGFLGTPGGAGLAHPPT